MTASDLTQGAFVFMKPTLRPLSEIAVDKPFFGQVLITPEDAAVALGINRGNRRKRNNLVEYLSRQIKMGEWQPDHPQPIVFSDAGRLIDGQHRLFAICDADTEVTATVLCGVRDSLREYVDTGISRQLEDRLSFTVDTELNRRVSQVISCWLFTVGKPGGGQLRKRATPAEAWETFETHRDGLLFSGDWLRGKHAGICRASVAVALTEMFERDRDMAAEFAAAIKVPDSGLQQARMLRDWLLRSKSPGGARATKDVYLRCVCAMQACLDGREVKVIRATNWR